MGNIDSSNAFAGVDDLKDTLAGLETRLASIEAGHRKALNDAELDASNEDSGGLRSIDATGGGGVVVVAGATVSCNRGVSVLIGPVMGTVTGDSARVLLEIDRDAEIVAHVCLVDESCPAGRQVTTTSRLFKARQPACFMLTRLLPGERYIVCFSGLKRADALSRVADFRTVDLANREVRLLAVSGDHPEAVSAGEFNVMETVYERLKHPHLPHVDLLMHSGGNVHLKEAFEDAWVLLKRNAEVCSGEFDHRAWQTALESAEERLKKAYRFAWNLPFTRQCLAVTANLMIGGEDDIYPNFVACPELSAEGGGFVASTMIRLARRVYWSYQRRLWDDKIDDLLDADATAADEVTETMKARLVRQGLERAVARADGAVAELRSVKADTAQAEAILLSKRADLQDANTREQAAAKVSMKNSRGPAPLESSLVNITGHIGVLLLDSLFSALAADGSQLPTPDTASRVFLPETLWGMLENKLGVDSHIRCLIVVTAAPIADTTRDNTKVAISNSGEFDQVNSRWSANEVDQEHMLTYLFDWKSREAYRELLFVSGGVRCGSMSMIRDDLWTGSDSRGGRARQLIAGAITDYVEAWPFAPLEGRLGQHSRFSFRHRPLHGQRSYAEALITVPRPSTDISAAKLKGNTLNSVDQDRASFARVAGAKVIGQFFEEVRVVVGPVIGTVTSTSAVVLVEVDSSAPVAAVLTDTLSGAQIRQLRLLPKSRPYAFGFEGLDPARHYSLRLEGVENADSRRGGFTTCEKATAGKFRLKALAVHSDRPYSSIHSSSAAVSGSDEHSNIDGGGRGFSLWRALETEASRPFGPDVFIHLGGQVEMASVVEAASTLLCRARRESGNAALELEEAARDTLRSAYRTHWNLPATRNALAHGCHLMLRGAQDIGELLLGSSKGGATREVITGTDRARLVALVEEVYREYQRQLWDPTLGLDGAVHLGCSKAPSSEMQGNGEWHYHQYGSVGFFLMDIRSERLKASEGASSGVPLVSADQWRGLNEVLSQAQGPSHLVMCSELPFISDSPDAAAMKASTSSHAHLASHWPAHAVELRKLMRGLFAWMGKESDREVTLLCGGAGYVLSSVLNQQGGHSIRQYISPPISDDVDRCWCEPFGSLDGKLSYAHGVALATNGVTFLDFTSSGGPVKCTHTPISTSDCESAPLALTQDKGGGEEDDDDDSSLNVELASAHLTDRPAAFKALLERPEWLELLMARAQAGTPSPPVQRRLDGLGGLLSRSDVRASLRRVFATDLRNGSHPWFANADSFAACAGPALQLWFHRSDDTLRAAAPAPSPLIVEAVARRWDTPEPRIAPNKHQNSAQNKPSTIFSGPSVRLALLDEESFADLVSEVLALSIVIQDRLRNIESDP